MNKKEAKNEKRTIIVIAIACILLVALAIYGTYLILK